MKKQGKKEMGGKKLRNQIRIGGSVWFSELQGENNDVSKMIFKIRFKLMA